MKRVLIRVLPGLFLLLAQGGCQGGGDSGFACEVDADCAPQCSCAVSTAISSTCQVTRDDPPFAQDWICQGTCNAPTGCPEGTSCQRVRFEQRSPPEEDVGVYDCVAMEGTGGAGGSGGAGGASGAGGGQLVCPVRTEPKSFFDDTFLDTAWSDELVAGRSMGTNSFAEHQETTGGNTGGNPDPYRGMTLTIGEGQVSLWQLNLKDGATYDPAKGAICGLLAQMDGTDLNAGTRETIYSMAFRQDGSVFWSDLFRVDCATNSRCVEGEGWLRMSPVDEADFTLFDPARSPGPDFTTAGAEIEFGFLAGAAGNNDTGAPRTFQYGVDNWQFVVCVCAPRPF